MGKQGPVVVGLVGCGRWGSLILRDLVQLGCEVHVVARSEASIANARANGARAVHPDLRALRSVPRIEGTVVATTAGQHFPVVMELLDLFYADFPIFCEKPFAINVSHAAEMAASAGHLFVMDKWRYHPAVRRMAEAKVSGEFGALVGLRASRVQPSNPHPDVAGAWTYLPHDLSIVLEVFGYIPPVSLAIVKDGGERVVALLGGALPSRALAEAETCQALNNGLWASIECSTMAQRKSRDIACYFERGALVMTDPLAQTLRLLPAGDGAPKSLPIPGEMPLLAELRTFVGHLRGGPPPRSSAADGLRVVSAVRQILTLPTHPALAAT